MGIKMWCRRSVALFEHRPLNRTPVGSRNLVCSVLIRVRVVNDWCKIHVLTLSSFLSSLFSHRSFPLPPPFPSPSTRYADLAAELHIALKARKIAVLFYVSICQQSTFKNAVASSGLDALPSLPLYLSVKDCDVPKSGRNPVKLAAWSGLNGCTVHDDSLGAKWIQLGDPSRQLNPKEYIPSLNTVVGRKHLIDASKIASDLCVLRHALPSSKRPRLALSSPTSSSPKSSSRTLRSSGGHDSRRPPPIM